MKKLKSKTLPSLFLLIFVWGPLQALATDIDLQFIELLAGNSEQAKMNELELYFDSLSSVLNKTKGLPPAEYVPALDLDPELPFKVKSEIERVYDLYVRYRSEHPDSDWFRDIRIPDQLERLKLELESAQDDLPRGVCRPFEPNSPIDELPNIFAEANRNLEPSHFQKAPSIRPANWGPEEAAKYARELHETGNFDSNVSIVSREDSGLLPAKEGINKWPAEQPVLIPEIVFHHTATAEIEFPDAAVVIQGMHFRRKMDDVGYHFLIDSDGNIYEGRSLQHAGGHVDVNNINYSSIGVVFVTNSSPKDAVDNPTGYTELRMAAPSPAAAQAALSLVATLQNPESDIVRQAEEAGKIQLRIQRSSGHQDHKATQCPGEGCLPLLSVIEEITEARGRN